MSDKSNPMHVWDAVEKTDPRYTKPFKKGGGFSGTDINPTYRMKVLTETFGPCGQGWGWTIVDRWRETFPIGDGEKEYVFVQLFVWWSDGEKHCHTGAQIGGTESGRAPDECWKMAITDAIGKCATSLGVCADVYMGEFDSKYQRPEGTPSPRKSRPSGEDTLLLNTLTSLAGTAPAKLPGRADTTISFLDSEADKPIKSRRYSPDHEQAIRTLIDALKGTSAEREKLEPFVKELAIPADCKKVITTILETPF